MTAGRGRGASTSGGQQRRSGTAMPTRVRRRAHCTAMASASRNRTTRSALGVLIVILSCPLLVIRKDDDDAQMRTPLHAGTGGGGIWGMVPLLAGAAAEEMPGESGVVADPVDIGAHDEETSSPQVTSRPNTDIGDETVTRDEAEHVVETEHAASTYISSEEAAEAPTAKKASERIQPLHHNDSDSDSDNATASAKKKVVAFGGFAGTAAAPGTDGRNTNTSATSQGSSSSNSSNNNNIIRSDDIVPPDGFVLASRIVSIDGLSYFVDVAEDERVDGESKSDAATSTPGPPPPVLGDLTIPFLDCGAVGSFTDAIGMRDCSFRHLPSGAEPFGWSTVDTPQIVVALQPLEVTVSGGGGDDGLEATRRNFRAGDVLLFEDTEGKGHKMKAAPMKKKGATGGKPAPIPSLHPDMSVLIVSLPPQKRHGNHHRGAGTGTGTSSGNGGGSEDKTTIRLPALFGKRKNHNKEGETVDGDPPRPCLVETDGTYSSLGPPASQTLSDVLPSPGRIIRGAVGAVLSALATDRWLGRGQPRVSGWLGGCALVVGGTCGFAAVGEGTLESLADWWEEFVISRRFSDSEDGNDAMSDKDNDILDLEGLKEEIKEEILPTLFAGRNSSEKL